jgi:hypothetical protein
MRVMKRSCTVCDNTGWVCESHPTRPYAMFSERADVCHCGGAGMPCLACNDGDPPELPPDFTVTIDDKGSRH